MARMLAVLMRKLRSALFVTLLAGSVAVMGIACLPVLLASPAMVFRPMALWARLILWLAARVAGMEQELRGLAHVDGAGPVILAAKHQSAWDTIVFLAVLPHPAYILKRELLALPIYGWYAQRAGMIAINRSGGAGALRAMVTAARAAAAAGRSIVIFPEGTRMPPGEDGRLQPGVVALAEALGLPVHPVAIASGHAWGRGLFGKRPGRMLLEVLPALSAGLDRRALAAALADAISTGTRRLEAEVQTGSQEREVNEDRTEA